MIQNKRDWFCDENGCTQKLGTWSRNSNRLMIDLHRLLIYIKPIEEGKVQVKVTCPVCRTQSEIFIPEYFKGQTGSDAQGIPWHCINPICEVCFAYWQFTNELIFDLLKPGSDYRVYLYVGMSEGSRAEVKQICRRCREENVIQIPDVFM